MVVRLKLKGNEGPKGRGPELACDHNPDANIENGLGVGVTI